MSDVKTLTKEEWTALRRHSGRLVIEEQEALINTCDAIEARAEKAETAIREASGEFHLCSAPEGGVCWCGLGETLRANKAEAERDAALGHELNQREQKLTAKTKLRCAEEGRVEDQTTLAECVEHNRQLTEIIVEHETFPDFRAQLRERLGDRLLTDRQLKGARCIAERYRDEHDAGRRLPWEGL